MKRKSSTWRRVSFNFRFPTPVCQDAKLIDLVIQVRSLYAYEGQRDVDVSFPENVIILAHPAKDASSPWWYGMVVKSGEKGWFPHSYVDEIICELLLHRSYDSVHS